jgi:hypothetical protein
VKRTSKSVGNREKASKSDARARSPWAPTSPNSPFIDETLAFWQPRSRRVLTREDAREIIENVAGFFAILEQWDRAEREAIGKKTSNPSAIETSDPTDH